MKILSFTKFLLIHNKCYFTHTYSRSFSSKFKKMANSKFGYVRSFEADDCLPPEQWIVLSLTNNSKNNPEYYLRSSELRTNYFNLMHKLVTETMTVFKDIKFGYLHFNTIHVAFPRNTTVYQRRTYKLLPYVTSCMTASFVRFWPSFFSDPLQHEMSVFNGRVHLFPTDQTFRSYFTMTQGKHHQINLLHTLCLVHSKQMSEGEADLLPESECLSSGDSSVNINVQINAEELASSNNIMSEDINMVKSALPSITEVCEILRKHEGKTEDYYNELLFSEFSVNYNNEKKDYKKGLVINRKRVKSSNLELKTQGRNQSLLESEVIDFRKNTFWDDIFDSTSSTQYDNKLKRFVKYEICSRVLNHCWTVVRIDGKGFHKLSDDHSFEKPNDLRAINLMNEAAQHVMEANSDILFGFGESDEYSFVFDRYGRSFERQTTLLVSQIVSQFTAAYVYFWPKHFTELLPLKYNPMFDGRAVMYPTNSCLRDYLSWRQADCHINNMYNTVYWKLVQDKDMTPYGATKHLEGTFSIDKKNILKELGYCYEKEPAIHRKGSILYRRGYNLDSTGINQDNVHPRSTDIVLCHEDIISEDFWTKHSYILGSEKSSLTFVDE